MSIQFRYSLPTRLFFQQIVAGTAGQIRRFVPARHRIDCDHFLSLQTFRTENIQCLNQLLRPVDTYIVILSALITIDIIKEIFAVQLAQSLL